MDVNVRLLKRNPSTLTAPVAALNSTVPRWPATDAKPGTERSTIAVRAPVFGAASKKTQLDYLGLTLVLACESVKGFI
jgi:hypothetical protein